MLFYEKRDQTSFVSLCVSEHRLMGLQRVDTLFSWQSKAPHKGHINPLKDHSVRSTRTGLACQHLFKRFIAPILAQSDHDKQIIYPESQSPKLSYSELFLDKH